MQVLMLTSVWPTAERPELAPFVVRQVRFLERHGVNVTVVPVQGDQNPKRYAEAWKQVRTLLAGGRFDLIHAQWAQSAMAALPSPLPLVVTFRGSDVEGILNARQRYTAKGWVLRQVARSVARVADETILVADRLARRLPRRLHHVIPSGLDLDLFKPGSQWEARARLGLAPDGRYILFAAAPKNPVKRHALALAAVKQIKPRYRAELVVASGIAPELMPLYMNACDALLLTSSHEGSPNVVKEALACNLSVVSTDVGDVAERIASVDGCFLCRGANPDELATSLEQVLERERRIAGRPAVCDLDESTLTAKVIAVYERALARARGGSRVKGNYEDLLDRSLPQ
jgi:glycosyltransferase involved in cell wall biosynthesis